MYYAIRIAVMTAIVLAHYVARGHSSFGETFATYLAAIVFGHVTVIVLARIVRSKYPDRPNPNAHATLALAGSSIAIIAFALVVRLFAAHHDGPIRYQTVDFVMADPASWLDEDIKLHGYVELGSMQVGPQMTRTFVLTQNKQRVAARFAGLAPDTFKDRAEVVATGRLTRAPDGAYLFVATDVIAKCPSTYQTANGPVPAARFR
jgi:cytochrome c-type biogenesis protein CcmE